MFSGVAMQRLDIRTQRGDSHLWLTALGLSLLANTALVATVGFVTMKSLRLREKSAQAPKPPAVPEDVAAAPESAEKTASGIASRVLTKGIGTVHPKATDQVKVHYSGWTTDGKIFDSSVMRDEPIVFPLNQVIPGWTEGVQLMVEGEKRRLWIPAKLAYGESPPPGAPAGTLVFDVELIQIVK